MGKFLTLNRTENRGKISIRKEFVYVVSAENNTTCVCWRNGGGYDKCDYVLESVEEVTAMLEEE